MAAEVETTKDAEVNGVATRWLREIALADRHEKDWRERGEKIVKRYRDDDRKNEDGIEREHRFSILYANTQILRGVMYQKTPVPDVRRRFLDKDPVGRQVAQILQRALSYSVDSYDFDGTMEAVVDDILLPGRGTAVVKYIPTMGAETAGPDGQPFKPVAYQEVRCDYVEWDMLRISPAKRWSKVRWIALGELMTREDLVAAFGEKGKQVTLDWAPKDKEFEQDEMFKRALVWAIWSKKDKKVYFVSKGQQAKEEALAVVDDPLGLDGFFPIPKPVYAIPTTDSLIPVPEYLQYQDQAIELDTITSRIDALVSELRVRGVADTSIAEIVKAAKAGDGDIVPIEDAARMAMIMEKGGLEKAILFWPIEMIAGVLDKLYLQREQVKATIYEITGLSDIVRGSSKASETATAQEIKGRYANVRVGPRQKTIAHLARDIFRMKAEIISEKFTPETLKLMTGPDLWMIETEGTGPDGKPVRQKVDATQQIMALLRNDRLRGFRVDIETDSTVLADSAEDQKNRIELLQGIATFLQGVGPAVQSGALPKEFAIEALSFGMRGFKLGPQLEEAIDRLRDQGDQAASPQKAQEMMAQAQQQAQAIQEKGVELEEREKKLSEKETKFELDTLRRSSDLDVREVTLNAEERISKAERESKQQDTENASKIVESVAQQQSEGAEKSVQAAKQIEDATNALAEHEKQIADIGVQLQNVGSLVEQLMQDIRRPRRRVPKYGANGRISEVTDEMVPVTIQ